MFIKGQAVLILMAGVFELRLMNSELEVCNEMNILWDFDGTLVDSYPVFTKLFRKVLNQETPEHEILSHLKISLSHAIKHYELNNQQVKRIIGNEETIKPSQITPFPNVEDVLKMAKINVIMTHNSRSVVLNILKYYNLEHYFKEVITGDDGYPRKPDRTSYGYLHNKYNLDLVIGDREIDILPAKTLGIKTCLFQNNTPGADYYLLKYEDFFTVVIDGPLNN